MKINKKKIYFQLSIRLCVSLTGKYNKFKKNQIIKNIMIIAIFVHMLVITCFC